MVRPDFRDFVGSNSIVCHSAKGSSWEKPTKFILKKNGKYYYPDSYPGGHHLPKNMRQTDKNPTYKERGAALEMLVKLIETDRKAASISNFSDFKKAYPKVYKELTKIVGAETAELSWGAARVFVDEEALIPISGKSTTVRSKDEAGDISSPGKRDLRAKGKLGKTKETVINSETSEWEEVDARRTRSKDGGTKGKKDLYSDDKSKGSARGRTEGGDSMSQVKKMLEGYGINIPGLYGAQKNRKKKK